MNNPYESPPITLHEYSPRRLPKNTAHDLTLTLKPVDTDTKNTAHDPQRVRQLQAICFCIRVHLVPALSEPQVKPLACHSLSGPQIRAVCGESTSGAVCPSVDVMARRMPSGVEGCTEGSDSGEAISPDAILASEIVGFALRAHCLRRLVRMEFRAHVAEVPSRQAAPEARREPPIQRRRVEQLPCPDVEGVHGPQPLVVATDVACDEVGASPRDLRSQTFQPRLFLDGDAVEEVFVQTDEVREVLFSRHLAAAAAIK